MATQASITGTLAPLTALSLQDGTVEVTFGITFTAVTDQKADNKKVGVEFSFTDKSLNVGATAQNYAFTVSTKDLTTAGTITVPGTYITDAAFAPADIATIIVGGTTKIYYYNA